jgi:hypothetical protein
MCYYANGYYPLPLISYSNWSIVIGFCIINFAYAFWTHFGLKVSGKLPVDFLLTGKSFVNCAGIEK